MVSSSDAAPVRVRFAPSPTGLLHIGGLRTALYNWLLARQAGGTFILRIEDTDRSRYVEEAEQDITGSLAWAGLTPDEGPEQGGPHAPYYQSERGDLYREAAARLIEQGDAYYAFDTEEELQTMRDRLEKAGNPSPKYDAVTRMSMKNSITLPDDEVAERLERGDEHVVRLKVPRRETIRFEDMIRGWVSFEAQGLDDQVLVKSDGMPTYHLANVVDDHTMEITHVIRGEEWLSSVPKHVLLYNALGWEPPKMAHLPLILSPEGGKLSKRSAETLGIPVNVRQYREAGYEPEAVVNFLAFLGWNPGDEREVFAPEELVEAFEVERIGKSGVQFSMDKLEWYNGRFIRRMDLDTLAEKAAATLEAEDVAYDAKTLREACALMQERIQRVGEMATFAGFFFKAPTEYDAKGVKKRWKEDSADLLAAYADRLEALNLDAAPVSEGTDVPEGLSETTVAHAAAFEAELRALADERDCGAGRIIHPTRLAVSGMSFGPSLFEMMAVVGRDACVQRIHRAIDELG